MRSDLVQRFFLLPTKILVVELLHSIQVIQQNYSIMSPVLKLFLLFLAALLGRTGSQKNAMYELASIYSIESHCRDSATKVQVDFQSKHLRTGARSLSHSNMEVLQFSLMTRDAKTGDNFLFERQTVENQDQTLALCIQPGNNFWLTLYSYIPASIDKQARSSVTSSAVSGALLCNKHILSLNEMFEITQTILDSCLSHVEARKETTRRLKSHRKNANPFHVMLDVNDPTVSPSLVPSHYPTRKPTKPKPTPEPSDPPTSIPTSIPTSYPTAYPTPPPTSIPTSIPTSYPSPEPTSIPTATPTFGCNPSNKPTDQPSSQPSAAPTSPTSQPTSQPSQPSSVPTAGPSIPSVTPTLAPSVTPSVSVAPTLSPSLVPTQVPSEQPSLTPSTTPSLSPAPTESPSTEPSAPPTMIPTLTPSRPTAHPTIADIDELPRPTVGAPGSGTPQDAGSKKAFVETDTGIGTLAGAGVVVLAIVVIVVYYCVRASRNVVKVPQAPPNLAMRI